MVQFKKIRVGKLFSIKPTKHYDLTNEYLFDGGGLSPVVTNSESNNGITGWTSRKPTMPGGMITYSDTTSENSIFYQPKPFVGYSHIQGLTPLDDSIGWSRESLLYFLTAFRKASAGRYSYGSKFNRKKALDELVVLPVTDSGQLDVQYMEQYIKRVEADYIKRVEADYIKRVEAYLATLGYESLDDCELSSQDLKILSGPDEWGEFRIDKLFDIYPTNHYDLTNDLLFDENGINPVVTNSEVDNGITGFTNLKTNMPGNIITFSDTTSERSIFYQADPFVGYSHVQGLHPINGHQWLKKELLYFMTAFRVASTGKYNYGSKFNRQKALDEVVYLPVHDDGSIDYDYMNAYITAIEKKKVLKLKQAMDHKLELYREVSHQN